MATIRDLLTRSLRLINVLAVGEEMSASEGSDALASLVDFIDAQESLTVPVKTTVTKPLVAGESTYTIGVYPSPQPDPLPDNHIEQSRPIEYLNGYVSNAGGTDYPLKFVSSTTQAHLPIKTTSARPSWIYVKNGWPLDTLIMDTQAYDGDTLIMEVHKPLTDILPGASLNEEIDLPPGYARMLRYNMAVELAPEWEVEPSFTVLSIASSSMQAVKRKNFKAPDLVSGAPGTNRRGRYDITGGPG